MTKELNASKLNEIFDIELSDEEYDIPEEDYNESVDITTSEDSVLQQISALLASANNMLKKTEDIVMRAPSPESISAASSMILSIHKLISEINKSVLTDRRFDRMEKLEKSKTQNKLQTIEAKNKNTLPQLGNGSTITQNNFYSSYSHEKLIDFFNNDEN